MARGFSKTTLKRLEKLLDAEEQRLVTLISDLEEDRRDIRLSESSADRSADPDNVEGGALAVSLGMEVSKQRNAEALLQKVRHAQRRMEQGTYGVCEISGKQIPLKRLEALPYATTTVEAASRR